MVEQAGGVLKTNYRFNSGFFEGCIRSIDSDSPELVGQEAVIAGDIRKKLKEQDRVVLVDLGAMFAASAFVIAKHFEPEIKTGRITVIASNREKFNPEVPIDAAKETAHWNKHQPIYPDMPTLEFIKRNLVLVRFANDIDSSHLYQELHLRNIGPADIIHENFGGLFHVPVTNGRNALNGVIRALKSGGILFTTETPCSDTQKYGDSVDIDLIPDEEYYRGGPGYRRYRKK